MVLELAQEKIWFDKWRYEEAEKAYYEAETLIPKDFSSRPDFENACEILDEPNYNESETEEHVEAEECEQENTADNYTPKKGSDNMVSTDLINRVTKLEIEKKELSKTVSTLEQAILNLTKRLASLECSKTTTTATTPAITPKKVEEEEVEDDDDDVDLFGSDEEEEDEAAARVREERLKAYSEKKSKKPGPIAKSSVLLDCKPWSDETDMKQMEDSIRGIEMEGLVWGASKLVPLAYGIKKLSILCIVVDDLVSIDDLSEKICEMEEYVQSVDIGAFNKI